jgi:hypothetical protein
MGNILTSWATISFWRRTFLYGIVHALIFINKLAACHCQHSYRVTVRSVPYVVYLTMLSVAQNISHEWFFSVALQSFLDLGRLTYRRFLELFRHMVGFLGRVISLSQGLYLHRTTQHRKTRTNIHALSGIRTHDPSNQPAKTHASDRTATMTGIAWMIGSLMNNELKSTCKGAVVT